MAARDGSGRVLWTCAEDAALREHYPEEGPSWGGWSELLPGRSMGAIKSRASYIGIHHRRHRSHKSWTDAERRALLVLCDEMVRRTGHSVSACAQQYAKLRRQAETRAARKEDE